MSSRGSGLAVVALLSAALLAAVPAGAQVGAAPRKGDTNADGKLNVVDALVTLQFVAGIRAPSAAEAAAADINADGKVNVLDVITILKVAAGLAPPPTDPATPPDPGTPPVLEGATLQLDQRYTGGTRVQAPWVGISFVVPPDWAGGITKQDEVFLMASTVRAGMAGMVMALASLPTKPSVETVAQLMAQPIDVGGGLIFTPDGQPRASGSRITNTFRATSTLGPLVGVGMAQVGSQGNALSVLLAGPTQESAYLTQAAETFINSAVLGKSQLDQWWQLVVGSTFRTEGGSYSQTGPGESVSTTNNTFINLCSEGRFTYRYVGYVSTSAGMVESKEAKAGAFTLGMDLLGPGLVLSPNDGSDVMSYRLQAGGQTVYIDETEAVRFAGEPCP